MIKPETIRILGHDTWEEDSVFIVDPNATITRDFANITTDYQKLLLEIGVRVDGHRKT